MHIQLIIQTGSQIPFTVLGGSLLVPEIGESPWFGPIYYHPDAPANVFSFSDMTRHHFKEWNQDQNAFFVIKSGGVETLKFILKDGLYVCNMRDLLNHAFVTTTLENEKKFTKREVFQARGAKELSQLLAYQP
jgi:hypothetical protein